MEARHARAAPITALQFAEVDEHLIALPSAMHLVSGAADGSACVWRVHAGALALLPLRVVLTNAGEPPCTCVSLLGNGTIAAGDAAGRLRVWAPEANHLDGSNARLVWEWAENSGGGGPWTRLTSVCLAAWHHPSDGSSIGWIVAFGADNGMTRVVALELGHGGNMQTPAAAHPVVAAHVLATGSGYGPDRCMLDSKLLWAPSSSSQQTVHLLAACADGRMHSLACAVVAATSKSAAAAFGRGVSTRADSFSLPESPRVEVPALPPPVPSPGEEESAGMHALRGRGAPMRTIVAQTAALHLSRSRSGAQAEADSDDWLLAPLGPQGTRGYHKSL